MLTSNLEKPLNLPRVVAEIPTVHAGLCLVGPAQLSVTGVTCFSFLN
jgi:hypothetical protein